jgi:hypothetical protein
MTDIFTAVRISNLKTGIYRVIQSSTTILKEVVTEIIWRRNVNKVFTYSPLYPSYDFLRWCHFYYCHRRFLQNRKQFFLHKMSTEFLICSEKEILLFVACFNRHFRVLPFEYFSNRVVGTYQRYRYYCPSLLIVLQLDVLPRILTEFPLNYHSNTERHQHKNVVTRKRQRISRKNIFCPNWYHQQSPLVLHCSFESPCTLRGLCDKFANLDDASLTQSPMNVVNVFMSGNV